MKIVFDHIEGFGKVSDLDFICGYPMGIAEPGDHPKDLLAQGWIPWDGAWYNLRSVRINTLQHTPTKTTRKNLDKIYCVVENFEPGIQYETLYEKYCQVKGFTRTITWDQLKSDLVLNYYHNNKLIGCSLVDVYPDAMVAKQFIWDYETPLLSLGNLAQYFECMVARTRDIPYVYILGGYESCCVYKSNHRGFEWWTGSEWSRDVELYKQLCLRDDQIQVSLV